MHTLLRAGGLPQSPSGVITFEGEDYGSAVSLFLVDNEPGQGPDLHTHPYPETWIVRAGTARVTVDGEEFEARPGDIVVIGHEAPHKFKNAGPGRLEIVCIHPSARVIRQALEEHATA